MTRYMLVSTWDNRLRSSNRRNRKQL